MNKSVKKGRWKYNEILAILVVVWFAIAWFIGKQKASENLEPFFKKAIPEAIEFRAISSKITEAISSSGESLGFISVGEASGYGGPMSVAIAIDSVGNTTCLAVTDHRETPTFFDKTIKTDLLKNLVKKQMLMT